MLARTDHRTPVTASPVHDRPRDAAGVWPSFYLVGEAERSMPAPSAPAGRTTIRINGTWHALRGRTATFAQLLRLAFPTAPLANPGAATMSYRGGIGLRATGLLTPGDVIELADSLVINANATAAS